MLSDNRDGGVRGDTRGMDDLADRTMGVDSSGSVIYTMHDVCDRNQQGPANKQQEQKQANSFC